MPLLIGAIMAIAVITAIPKGDARPIGYVDLAGVIAGRTGAGLRA